MTYEEDQPRTFEELERQQDHIRTVTHASEKADAWRRVCVRIRKMVETLPTFPFEGKESEALAFINRRLASLDQLYALVQAFSVQGGKKILNPIRNELISYKEALSEGEIMPYHCGFSAPQEALKLARAARKRADNRAKALASGQDVKDLAAEQSFEDAARVIQKLEASKPLAQVQLPPGQNLGFTRSPLISTIKSFNVTAAQKQGIPVQSLAGYPLFLDQLLVGVRRGSTLPGQTPLAAATSYLGALAGHMGVSELAIVTEKPLYYKGASWFWASTPQDLRKLRLVSGGQIRIESVGLPT